MNRAPTPQFMQRMDPEVGNVRFVEAGPRGRATGVVWYATVTLCDGLVIDGIIVRFIGHGWRTFGIPILGGAHRRRRPVIGVVDSIAAAALDEAIVGELERQLRAPGGVTR